MRRATPFTPEKFDAEACAEGFQYIQTGTTLVSAFAFCFPLVCPVGYLLLSTGFHNIGPYHRSAALLKWLSAAMVVVSLVPLLVPYLYMYRMALPEIWLLLVIGVVNASITSWYFWMTTAVAEDICYVVEMGHIAPRIRLRRNLFVAAISMGSVSTALSFAILPLTYVVFATLTIITGATLSHSIGQVRKACSNMVYPSGFVIAHPASDKPEAESEKERPPDNETSGRPSSSRDLPREEP